MVDRLEVSLDFRSGQQGGCRPALATSNSGYGVGSEASFRGHHRSVGGTISQAAVTRCGRLATASESIAHDSFALEHAVLEGDFCLLLVYAYTWLRRAEFIRTA